MTLGLISDTHGRLPPAALRALAGVDRILHAGDVGPPSLIAELARLAPVTVVHGNTDSHAGWPDFESVEIGPHRILVEHIVSPHHPSPSFRLRLQLVRPTVVVFGHTHRPFAETLEGILYVNPGSAGAPRFGLPPSICRLHLDGDRPRHTFVELA
ncbi:MAG: metallophosphoesterase family protein [Verrucomicrobiae bacterium]|nr:metallophosphoesterase family protein [Verrucomicrobiae bacterium]